MRRGLVSSVDLARVEVGAGRVTVAGAPASNPARLVGPADPIVVHDSARRFVSRGGEKLDAALERFGIEVDGRRVVDVGASTGGFTDCVLQRGAREVVAVDVGYGLLHERLVKDERVRCIDRTSIRDLDRRSVGVFDLVVADLSFISLERVLDELLGLCDPEGDLVLLVKPQFEATRREADKGHGVIRDPGIWRRVLEALISAVQHRSAAIIGVMASPITGAEGNVEFLVAVHRTTDGGHGTALVDLDAVLAEACERQRR